jgi:hypothetical protein
LSHIGEKEIRKPRPEGLENPVIATSVAIVAMTAAA